MLLLGVLVAVLGATAGCDTDDGRALRDPAPGATAPPLATGSTSTTAAALLPPVGSAEDGAAMELLSSAFAEGQPIPDRYGCAGQPAGTSPPLTWTGIPTGTVELALTVVDITTEEQRVHWVVTGLDPSLLGLEEGRVPEGAVEARNDSSEFGWYGPCPPAGETHTYLFTLFALTTATGVAQGTGGPEAVAMIAAAPGAATTLSGTFTGPPEEAAP